MSIRQGLLSLLAEGPRHGYQLRQDFEQRTGATWPLNVGQVYTTLARLARDGLVEMTGETDDQQKVYALTTSGRRELDDWFRTPIELADRPRDELAIKLAMAAMTPGVVLADVVQAQRTATVQAVQDYTRLKAKADPDHDVGWLLVLDSLLFQAEAELRWLDACEERLSRAAAANGRKSSRSAAGTAGAAGKAVRA